MGPLAGIKIVEFAGIGPAPMAAMMLAEMGACVLRIERKTQSGLGLQRPIEFDLLMRGRKAIALNLKDQAAVDLTLRLIERSDGLIEGFRPGVMERLGLGPDDCFKKNRKLVFGRMTGWGQEGPLSQAAGHDLNYIALTGALAAFGRKGEKPVAPLNLLGDFAGGALYLAFGMVCALLEARTSGAGQVVDAAIVDGTAHLMTGVYGSFAGGLMNLERGTNAADTGSFFYEVYSCSDGKLISIASIEKKFYLELLQRLGVDEKDMPGQFDAKGWDEGKEILQKVFAQKTRDDWCAILEGTDVCFAPVLTMAEAPSHPHMKAREVFQSVDGVVQPAPAPRFSRTRPEPTTPPRKAKDTPLEEALDSWMTAEEISELRSSGLAAVPQ
jgi:alpha-methylacyl-CoA racemase